MYVRKIHKEAIYNYVQNIEYIFKSLINEIQYFHKQLGFSVYVCVCVCVCKLHGKNNMEEAVRKEMLQKAWKLFTHYGMHAGYTRVQDRL